MSNDEFIANKKPGCLACRMGPCVCELQPSGADVYLFAQSMTSIAAKIHGNAVAKGFYTDVTVSPREVGLRCALIASEAFEAFEEARKLIDSNHDALASELADVVIRTMDLAAFLGIDLGEAVLEKHQKNLSRPYKHGKQF
jgi:NTP pyrophosphatase (non-canonical NTP hydrolase)